MTRAQNRVAIVVAILAALLWVAAVAVVPRVLSADIPMDICLNAGPNHLCLYNDSTVSPPTYTPGAAPRYIP